MPNTKIKKKKILWQSNIPLVKTGLGRNTRSVLEYLHQTNKFEIVLYAQGVLRESPEYQKFPYKVIGCLPNNQQELDNINRDQNYARIAAYGGHMIDQVLQEEKPDILVMSDDLWSFPYLDKPWFSKFPCVYHVTVDSTPVLEEGFKQAAKTPYYFTWTDFANKDFHSRGLNHVKSIPGAIDEKDFYKKSWLEKIELRDRFNIPRDSFICGFVFRNQLRKEVGPLIEGYGIWKRENINVKSYLLLHTHWSEPAGWDIHRFCNTYGVDKNEILTSYICRACQNIEVSPFTEQDRDCRFCAGQKTQVTCNVGCGCTETQLNEIYNLFDCYCHLMNAGGLEIPIIESLYCEVPTATVAYSCGKTFTKNDFITEIDFAWTLQLGTQFNRAAPYPQSVVKFLNKIYKMEPRKRQEVGRKSREWALSVFSPSIVGKQWEDLFDSIPAHDYNFEFKEELKNPDFPFPETSNDEEFVVSLYENILKAKPDDKGKTDWLNGLKNGQSKKQIYDFFIDLARKDNSSKQTEINISLEDIFPRIEGKKNVLLVLPQSFGDHVILAGLLPKVYEKYPLETHQIFLAADPKYWDVHQGNENIKLVIFHPAMDMEMVMIGAGGNGPIDHYVNIPVASQKVLNYLTNKY